MRGLSCGPPVLRPPAEEALICEAATGQPFRTQAQGHTGAAELASVLSNSQYFTIILVYNYISCQESETSMKPPCATTSQNGSGVVATPSWLENKADDLGTCRGLEVPCRSRFRIHVF